MPPDVKQKHYINVIESLLQALDQVNGKSDQDAEGFDEINDFDKSGYQFKTQVSWEHTVGSPKKTENVLKQMEYEMI